jgi:hypothetical protein
LPTTFLMDHHVAAEQLRTHTLLGLEATYRVIDVSEKHALVEVVEAPGLNPGTRFRYDIETVDEMRVVDRRAEVERGLARLLTEVRPAVSKHAA